MTTNGTANGSAGGNWRLLRSPTSPYLSHKRLHQAFGVGHSCDATLVNLQVLLLAVA